MSGDAVPEHIEDDEIEVVYCHMIDPGFCSGRFSNAHTRFCDGGYEVPQSGYAWLLPGPWRKRGSDCGGGR